MKRVKGKPSGEYIESSCVSTTQLVCRLRNLNPRGKGRKPNRRVDWLNLDLCVDDFQRERSLAGDSEFEMLPCVSK